MAAYRLWEGYHAKVTGDRAQLGHQLPTDTEVKVVSKMSFKGGRVYLVEPLDSQEDLSVWVSEKDLERIHQNTAKGVYKKYLY